MQQLVLASKARTDLFDIDTYSADRNQLAAERLIQAISQRHQRFACGQEMAAPSVTLCYARDDFVLGDGHLAHVVPQCAVSRLAPKGSTRWPPKLTPSSGKT